MDVCKCSSNTRCTPFRLASHHSPRPRPLQPRVVRGRLALGAARERGIYGGAEEAAEGGRVLLRDDADDDLLCCFFFVGVMVLVVGVGGSMEEGMRRTHHAAAVEHGVPDCADGGAVPQGVPAGDEEEIERLELGGEGEETADGGLRVVIMLRCTHTWSVIQSVSRSYITTSS